MRSLKLRKRIQVVEPKGPQITIEIEPGASDRIAGRLLDEQDGDVPFDGWLGLAAVRKRVLAPPDGPDASAPGHDEAPN